MFFPILSGLLSAAAFPVTIGGRMLPAMGWLAFVSLVPWLLAIRDAPPRAAVTRTFVVFFVLYLGSTWWMIIAMTTFGHLAWPPSILAHLLFCIIVSASHAAAAGLAAWLGRRLKRSIWSLLPFTFVVFELQRNYWPSGGCPWSALGYALAPYPVLIQAADIFGIYGLTVVVLLVNLGVATLVVKVRKAPASSGSASGGKQSHGLIFPMVGATALLFLIGYGLFRFPQVARAVDVSPTKKIALLQGNIPQDQKYDRAAAGRILQGYLAMSREAVSAGADLIVWPEAAYPYNVPAEARGFKLDLSWSPVPFLIGVVGEGIDHETEYYTNSAWLIRPTDGQVVGRYDKHHLVPLGEYVPFGPLLGFLHKLVPEIGDFRRGRSSTPLHAGDTALGMTICLEDVYPELSHAFARAGVDLFVNITNDAWYGDSPQNLQHFYFSRVRAVEHRRTVVRATNTGLTGMIDPAGRMSHLAPRWERHLVLANAPIHDGFSLYTRIGDLFVWLIIGSLTLMIASTWRRKF